MTLIKYLVLLSETVAILKILRVKTIDDKVYKFNPEYPSNVLIKNIDGKVWTLRVCTIPNKIY